MIELLVLSLHLAFEFCGVRHPVPTEEKKCEKLCGMCLMAMQFSADASTFSSIAKFLLFLALHLGYN